MSRTLKVRQPRPAEIRRLLQWIEEPLDTPQQRRSQAILLYHDSMSATEIAMTLQAHVNTILADLHAFDQQGLSSVTQVHQRGVSPRLTPAQKAEICRLADQAPSELGLPYGRWSLSKLRTYLLRQRLVKTLRREHLRRILKKGGSPADEFNASSSVVTPSARRFWPAFVGAGGICPRRVPCSSSISNRWWSKPMADDAIPRPSAWSWSAGKRPGVVSTCFWPMI